MIKLTTLRIRFVATFGLFALLISGINVLLVMVVEREMADEFFERRLNAELEYFVERYQRDSSVPLPVSEDIRAYMGTDQMPDLLREFVRHLPDGVYSRDLSDYQMTDDRSHQRWKTEKNILLPELWQEDNVFFGVRTLSADDRVFIFINFAFWKRLEREVRAYAFWIWFGITLIAIFLGLFVSNQMLGPLSRLVTIVRNATPTEIPSGFSAVFKGNEIGELARTLDDALNRVKRFVDREKRFTRDASHELRTPVTVSKGALELLNSSSIPKDEMTEKLIQRIDRANRDMEATIESLLWLARETNADQSAPQFDALPIVQAIIEQNRYLLTGKAVEFAVKAHEPLSISAPMGVLTIAISNLIRNACQYTTKGKITVELHHNRLEVSDTGPGIEEDQLRQILSSGVTVPNSDGFGFGLDIVTRICDRFGWQIKIENQVKAGTRVSLIFSRE